MSQPQPEPTHADSIASQENLADDKKKNKSRRPPNTAFRQQRLKAWQPILTPKTVLPLFFAVGIIFAPIGGLLLWASSQVESISINYADCGRQAGDNFTDIPQNRIEKHFKPSSFNGGQVAQWKRELDTTQKWSTGTEVSNVTVCTLRFTIENDLKPPILFYYRLTNFYQNHRRYVKSFDAEQLKGEARTFSQIESSDCDPLRNNDPAKKPYYPCGLIANSVFNDSFRAVRQLNAPGSSADSEEFMFQETGIAWSSDKDLYKKSKYKPEDVVPPPNWVRRYPNYTITGLPELEKDEAFQVWMRTAGLPSFSKLAKRNDKDVMKAGTYELSIWDEFDVTKYNGKKYILISTRTVMGGKNPFLGIAYIVVGGLCILLGALFTATHIIKPRKLGDHTYLTWDKETSATTTARAARPGEGPA